MQEPVGGYENSIFVGTVADHFCCRICLQVLRDPKQCKNGHCYCRTCILPVLSINEQCPTCLCALTVSSLGDNLVLRGMIGELSVRCSTTTELGPQGAKCGWNGHLHGLAAHLGKDCQFQAVPCGNAGCGIIIARRSLLTHRKSCQHRLQPCQYCNSNFTVSAIARHLTVCDKRQIACPSCRVSVDPKMLPDHQLNVCPRTLIACPMFTTVGKCTGGCNAYGMIARERVNSHICEPANLAGNFALLLDQTKALQASVTTQAAEINGLKDDRKRYVAEAVLLKLHSTILSLKSTPYKIPTTVAPAVHNRFVEDDQLITTLQGWLRLTDPVVDVMSINTLTIQLDLDKNVAGKKCFARHIACEFVHKAFADGANYVFNEKSPSIVLSEGDNAAVYLIRTMENHTKVQFNGFVSPRDSNKCEVHTTMFRFGKGPPRCTVTSNGNCDPMTYGDFHSRDGFVSDGVVRILATFLFDFDEIESSTSSTSSSSAAAAAAASASKKRKFY